MSEITEAATGVQPELEALLLLATEPLPVVVLAETVRQPESVVTEALECHGGKERIALAQIPGQIAPGVMGGQMIPHYSGGTIPVAHTGNAGVAHKVFR